MRISAIISCLFLVVFAVVPAAFALDHQVSEDDERIVISTPQLEAVIRKQGYVSGVAGGSFLDKKTGFRDAGFGLDIIDWIMEPGSDKAYRDQLPGDLAYQFGNMHHGDRAKRSIEGPQICTKAGKLDPQIIRGPDFTAVTMNYRYTIAAPGKRTGSLWEQTLVFPEGKRYFVSRDKITAVNESPAMFLRQDMPGHIKHKRGDTFSEIFLSYVGKIPASEFFHDFKPESKFNYRRDSNPTPERFIRAYRLRGAAPGMPGPWLAGMTLDPTVVHEAWCHQRGYVCMIQEFGGRPIKPGESFSAAFIVGFFDSIEEMQRLFDQHKGAKDVVVDGRGWKLVK